ncbi:threonine transporter RhtB [Paraburkholderia rhynchosiae]|uniref:Threonine transporter RhtB n=1 Tax=Paraburkholderia rhynchosiae TaxID=487049 RepID=A0ACC7NPG9_9BURK
MKQPAKVFNSSFELGVRMVFLLLALHPRKADLQTLVYMDYAAIYSADLGGPSSLHTPVPLRNGEYLSRRDVIEQGLYLMSTRGLVSIEADVGGIWYSAGESAAALVGLIAGEYGTVLAERCRWVADTVGSRSAGEIEVMFVERGLRWGAHFVDGGSDILEG